MRRVWQYIASAPLTYGWLVVLLSTTLVQHSLAPSLLRTLLQSTSTNLHHLSSQPVRVLFNSLFWIDGWYWWPYLILFTVFLAPAERWLGHLRLLIVGLICHVGATYLSEGFLYLAIAEKHAPPRLVDVRDVGVSYFVAGVAGVLFYRLPRRWRWLYLGALALIAVGALIYRTNYTSVGHLCALLIGLACYPLTRNRRQLTAADTSPVSVSDDDMNHLRRCVELAREALDAGDEPFGSVLVGADGQTLFEDRYRVKDGPHGGDPTRHPELEIARWAAANLAPAERASATVYTSCEHCPMCSAAHSWVGLGRIVYAVSSAQLTQWRAEWGATPYTVAPLPVATVAPTLCADGPVPQFTDEVKALHEANFRRSP
ncbi:rhomboid family intramembrane serine protease [Mycolicibacterium moriokaense]|nr:rhomboid family intramembrane serine protease [Mycolicibacterium moriokaense]